MSGFTPHASAPTVKIADIAYLRFTRRDLAAAEEYFRDFGLTVAARTGEALYLRGALPQHHCVIVQRGRHDQFVALALRSADKILEGR